MREFIPDRIIVTDDMFNHLLRIAEDAGWGKRS